MLRNTTLFYRNCRLTTKTSRRGYSMSTSLPDPSPTRRSCGSMRSTSRCTYPFHSPFVTPFNEEIQYTGCWPANITQYHVDFPVQITVSSQIKPRYSYSYSNMLPSAPEDHDDGQILLEHKLPIYHLAHRYGITFSTYLALGLQG